MLVSKPEYQDQIARITDWRKARRSNPSGNCVELAAVGDAVAMRDSKAPDVAVLVFTREEMRAFLGGAKDGDFDHLIHD
jgi:hypothetical protein